ncbi:MFS transporter [Acaryochloris sp. CCMEE 5410]|uniref:MFS transporter n=1 Tax=Acaryochloris sp. CCMEE 5410 TaxID=310037 RepID=UPI0008FFC6D4|nr:MFS transporter [Acaryochloris sp. CCMEE 5410]
MNKNLLLLLVCIFVLMVGFGITLPVLPYYAERLNSADRVSRETMVVHVSLLTSIYALMQFIFAPLWGKLSDRFGRKPLLLLGLGGSAIAQVLFGITTSLGMLYLVRGIDGLLSSAALPASTAYVSDITTERDRSRGMAWFGTATSLGVVAGPVVGGLSTRRDLHFNVIFRHIEIDSFSLPFLISAVLMLIMFFAAKLWLPESLSSQYVSTSTTQSSIRWQNLGNKLLVLLSLTAIGQLGLAIFEGTFALYAQEQLSYGPVETGLVFMICGLVMAVLQTVSISFFSRWLCVPSQIALGFSLMGVASVLLIIVRTLPYVLSTVGLLAFGVSLIAPNLSALISKRGGQHTGKALGMQNSANSLGQVGGPALGGMLFAWQVGAPYLFAGAILIGVGLTLSMTKKLTI